VNRLAKKLYLNLEEYNTSKYAYRELANFCLQYPEKKKQLCELRNPLKCQSYSGMPFGGGTSDQTARQADRAVKLSLDIDLIERTAAEVDRGLQQYIIWGVTQANVNYDILRDLKGMPCGKEYYYKRRRQFFYELSKKRSAV
jgi:hypothetical protein